MVYLTLFARRGDAARRSRDERGVVVVTFAMLLVFLVTLAAMTVDLGNVRQQQVNLQGAVDLAVLAGAQDLPNGHDATKAVLESVELNVGLKRPDWNGCQDPEALPHTVILPDVTGSNCISFNDNFTMMRVKLPAQAVTTFFGSVIGVDSFDVHVSAQVGSIVARSNRILPATVSAAVDPGLRCVETSGANTGCPTHVDGFFGSILSPRLYHYIPTTGNLDGEAQALNFALNLDHDVIPYTGGTAVCDGHVWSPCTGSNTGNSGQTGNHLVINTGNSVPPVTSGLVTGGSTNTIDFGEVTYCGRLTRPDFTADNAMDPLPDQCENPGEPTIDHIGYTINGRHLFHWMTQDARDLFYPEVSLDPNGVEPALDETVYHAGDARLRCFLAGYRFDVATGAETMPDCTSVGLTLPSAGLQYQATWTENYAGYNDPGSPAWADPWVEPANDSGDIGGVIQMNTSTKEILVTRSAPSAESVWRKINLPAGTEVVAIKGQVRGDRAGSNHIMEYSLDNVTWNEVAAVVGQVTIDHNLQVDTAGQPALYIRYRRNTDGKGNGSLFASNLTIDTYTKTAPNGSRLMDPIFDAAMVHDPRFAAIPIILDWPANGSKASPITGFWYAYIYDLYGNNTKVQAFDAWVFDPALMGHDKTAEFAGYGFNLNPFIRLEH